MKIPEEPAVTDLPSSPSEAFALGWRMAWDKAFNDVSDPQQLMRDVREAFTPKEAATIEHIEALDRLHAEFGMPSAVRRRGGRR